MCWREAAANRRTGWQRSSKVPTGAIASALASTLAKLADPSDYVPWSAIQEFCEKTGTSLEEFVIDLNFGLLD